MKQFIDHIQKSIFDPAYYAELPSRPSSFSWKYYWGLMMTIAVIMTIFTSLPLIPDLNRALHQFGPVVLEYYPDDLVISVDKGKVSTNMPEPYFLPIPSQWEAAMASVTPITHLAVIDTATPVSVEQFRAYSSFLWLARDLIVTESPQGDIRMSPFDPGMNMTLTEAKIRDGIAAVTPFFVFAAPFLVVLMFIAFVLRFVINLVYLIPASLLILLLGKILRQRWSFGAAYRIGLHAVTLPLIVEQIFLILPLSGFQLPFFTTFTLLLVVYVNYRNAPPKISDNVPPSHALTPPAV